MPEDRGQEKLEGFARFVFNVPSEWLPVGG